MNGSAVSGGRSPFLADRWMIVLVVGAGGAIGANLRWGTARVIAGFAPSEFPWATLVINVSGSFLIGCVLATLAARASRASEARLTRLFLATGVLGAYTTFSTFAYETVRLAQRGDLWLAAIYVVTSVALSVIACWAGIRVVDRRLAIARPSVAHR